MSLKVEEFRYQAIAIGGLAFIQSVDDNKDPGELGDDGLDCLGGLVQRWTCPLLRVAAVKVFDRFRESGLASSQLL